MKSLWCGITYYRPTDRQTEPEWRKWGMSQHRDQDTHPQNPVENQNWTRPEAPNTAPWKRERETHTPFSQRSLSSSPPLLPLVFLSCEFVASDTVCQLWSNSKGTDGTRQPELGPPSRLERQKKNEPRQPRKKESKPPLSQTTWTHPLTLQHRQEYKSLFLLTKVCSVLLSINCLNVCFPAPEALSCSHTPMSPLHQFVCVCVMLMYRCLSSIHPVQHLWQCLIRGNKKTKQCRNYCRTIYS